MAALLSGRLRFCRELENLTREQAAERASRRCTEQCLSASLIEDYEHGMELPYPRQIEAMADIYDVTEDFLLGRTNTTVHAGHVITL